METTKAFAGTSVQMLSVDYRLTLLLAGDAPDADLQLVLECPFVFTDGAGSTLQLDPEDDRTLLAPVLSLFGQAVRSAAVAEDGGLSLVFDSGARLDVEPHPAYEAWAVSGPRVGQWICVPGGGLCHFPGTPDDQTSVSMASLRETT